MTALKWFVLLAGIATAVPLGWALRSRPRLRLVLWTLLGALPFLGALDIGIVPLTGFLGDTHGLEIAAVDFVALLLLFSRPLDLRRVPYRWAMAAYLALAIFSVAHAALTLPALFYSWRLLRFFLLYVAVYSGARSVPVVLAVLRGVSIGVAYEFYLTMHQRLYTYQAPGSFAHQNSLGMAMNLALMAPVALLLARKADLLTMVTPLLGLVVVVLTRSRGTLIFFVLGCALVYGLSLLKGGTGRKILVGVLGGALALGVIGRAAHRITERFASAPESSMGTRTQFEKAASLMLRDHPAGIGPNHFAWYLSTRGYGQQVGLDYGNTFAIVHNLYWLTATELGPVGLLSLVVLLALPLVDAFRGAYRAPPADMRGDLLIGLGVSLLACYAQSAFEWIWRSTDVSYVFWIDVGLVAALVAQVRRRAERREARRLEKRRERRLGRARAREVEPVKAQAPGEGDRRDAGPVSENQPAHDPASAPTAPGRRPGDPQGSLP